MCVCLCVCVCMCVCVCACVYPPPPPLREPRCPSSAAADAGLFKNQRPPEAGNDRSKIDPPITLFLDINAAVHILLMYNFHLRSWQ